MPAEKKDTGTEKTLSFEESLEKLEKIVEQLESGKLGLENGLAEFEKGVKLYKECKEMIDKAENKVSVLMESLKQENYL